MNEFQHAKEEYESTPIPAELKDRVQAGIRQGKANRARRRSRTLRRSLTGVAACFAVLVGVLNVSPAAVVSTTSVLNGWNSLPAVSPRRRRYAPLPPSFMT